LIFALQIQAGSIMPTASRSCWPQPPTGLGSAGGFIGYGGVPTSVAIEFDTFNIGGFDGDSSNHVSIDENGPLTDLALANVYGKKTCNFSASTINTAPGCMSNGDKWTATISFDGSKLSIT
jgi:hypothetical protein